MKINGNLNRILSMLERARVESNKINRLEPIENKRFIYALSVGESCICFDCRLNESDTNRVMKESSVDKNHKKEKENYELWFCCRKQQYTGVSCYIAKWRY